MTASELSSEPSATILYIGTESTTRRYAVYLLRREGYDVSVADDFLIARALVSRDQPSVIIFDRQGTSDWASTLKQLRSIDPTVPILVLFQQGDSGPEGQVIQAQPDTLSLDCRPIQHAQLLKTISNLVRESDGHRS